MFDLLSLRLRAARFAQGKVFIIPNNREERGEEEFRMLFNPANYLTLCGLLNLCRFFCSLQSYHDHGLGSKKVVRDVDIGNRLLRTARKYCSELWAEVGVERRNEGTLERSAQTVKYSSLFCDLFFMLFFTS